MNTRDVYVRQRRECSARIRLYWLLMSASYGLLSANLKWKRATDNCFNDCRLQHLTEVPQLFYMRSNNNLFLIAVKAADDILMAATFLPC